MTKKIFTCVTNKTPIEIANSACSQLPVTLKYVTSVQELFPLLSDPNYNTDFVVIDVDNFCHRIDHLDMFDIIHTLAVLIKSTVYRPVEGHKPEKRNTKIIVTVDGATSTKLIKEIIRFTEVSTIGWSLTNPNDYQSVCDHVKRIVEGDFTIHPKVSELLKPKKKPVEKVDIIKLTERQSQILHLVQDRGASNKTIAKILGITESTVKLHIGAVLKKYGVRNRTQLALFAKIPD